MSPWSLSICLLVLMLTTKVLSEDQESDRKSTVAEAGQTIQKLLNERIGKKIVEAAKEVKGILSHSLGSHVKQATAKLLLEKAIQKASNQVSGSQNNDVAKVGTDQSVDECIKNCKAKKVAKEKEVPKPKIHHVQSMHKGAPSHKTPHNKGPRNRKNMSPPGQPPPPSQPGQDVGQQQQPPPSPAPGGPASSAPAAPTMPQTPNQLTCPAPCPVACAPACTQDCCRPMLSLVQIPPPPPPPPYYPPPPPPMCAPPCTQPSCAPSCPVVCCVPAPPPPPPPPPPPACPGVCVTHCYAICPTGCCRMDIPRKKHLISRKHRQHKKVHDAVGEGAEERETSSIISERKAGNSESSPMERNKIPRKKGTTYSSAAA